MDIVRHGPASARASNNGTSLDPNSPAGQEAQQPPTPPQSDPQQVMQSFLPQGGAEVAQPQPQSQPAAPQGLQPGNQAVPGPNQGINANPIDRNGAIGGSGMGGAASMQYMPKGAAARLAG